METRLSQGQITDTESIRMTMKWNNTVDKTCPDDNEMEQRDTADKSGPDYNEMEEPSQLVAEPGTSAPPPSSQDIGDQLVLAHR